jgi:alpha-D-xyloside xylohydrolase
MRPTLSPGNVCTVIALAMNSIAAAAGSQAPATYDSASYALRYQPAGSIYQDDGRLFHRAGFTYAVVTGLTDLKCDEGRFTSTAQLSDGTTAEFSLVRVGPAMLRMEFGKAGSVYPANSPMLAHPVEAAGNMAMSVAGGEARLDLDGYQARIGTGPFAFSLFNPAGERVMEFETEKIAGDFVTPPLGFRRSPGGDEPFLSWRIHNADHFYGLGEKWDKVEKSSTRATIWSSDTAGSNTTDLAYKSIPLLYCNSGWGLMLHSSYRSFWEIGTFSYTSGSFLTQDNRIDAFLFLGPTIKNLIGQYTGLTGRPAMPPLWGMGLWMSRCAYQNRNQVETVLKRLRAEDIPCDVVHLDSWMGNHYYFKIGVDAMDFVGDEERWPDRRGMLALWRSWGFAASFWINPYLPEGTPIYDEAKAKGYLLLSIHGGVARLAHGEPVGMVDFTNPAAKAWWQDHLKGLLADGVSVLKADYGDAVPEDALASNGQTGAELHNLYLHLYSQAVAEATREKLGYTLVWRRAGYIGTQRYPGTWAGDTQVSWEAMRCALRGGLSAGFGGEAFWSNDIGGFVGPKPTPELYIRWSEWGLLSPFARFHGTSPKEPWEYGPDAVRIVRHYDQLRYRLIPYFRECAEESVRTGLPILRHLSLEFPDDPTAVNVDDEFLLGPNLLVAPVLDEGRRDRPVYLPAGRWTAFEEPGRTMEGGRTYLVSAPLDRIPLFARSGAAIPRFVRAPANLKGELPPVETWRVP